LEVRSEKQEGWETGDRRRRRKGKGKRQKLEVGS